MLYLGVALARVGTAGSGGFTSSGERQWQSAMVSVIRPGNGSIELEEGWWIFGARLGRSGREESGHGDDGWSARMLARRAAGLGLHGSAAYSARARKRNGK